MESIEIFKNFELLGQGTSLFKQRAVFFYDPLDQYRPEAVNFRKMVSEFRSNKNYSGGRKLILYPESSIHPFYATYDFRKLTKNFPDAQICTYNQFLGIIPAEISDIYPAAHNLAAKKLTTYQTNDYPSFVASLKEFLTENNFKQIIIVADQFIKSIITNDRTLLKNLDAKVIDYGEDVTSII
jgi:7-cyano-7-deazaguanine tRNA-ribosyltransferase